ncbi:hypothetical protein K439DRAFT_1368611, partial [Ramaria rubella]
NVTMARHGYIGNAPTHPSLAFSTRMLQLLQVLTARCLQLSLQSFVKSICDIHRIAYRPTLRNQLSTAFDAYLEISRQIKHRVQTELQRNTPKWRLQNACVPCTYVLEDEPPLEHTMLVTMDGNESLKRMECARIEWQDMRTIQTDMHLNEEEVDRFKNEVKRRKLPQHETNDNELSTQAEQVRPVFAADVQEGRPVNGVDQPNPCVQRWANLADENTKKHLAIFRETGIFLAVCRHGTALVMCDMVRSSELYGCQFIKSVILLTILNSAKYPLAVTNELLDIFGSHLLCGYDIGCGFSTTANNSTLVGPKLRSYGSRFCVGSFHGHAHCRTCQLDWHPLYLKGCGLEDFETCERVFSRSNALASVTRYASTFHRRQLIHRWFESWNNDKYADSSKLELLAMFRDYLTMSSRQIYV